MATCGPSNAGAQLNKLVNTDNSLHHERVNNFPPSNAVGLRGDPRHLSQVDRQMLDSMQAGRPEPLRFDSFRKEVPMYGQVPHQMPGPLPQQLNNWTAEFQGSPAPQQIPNQATHNLSPMHSANSVAPTVHGSAWASEFQSNGQLGPSQPAYQPFRGSMGYMPSMGPSMVHGMAPSMAPSMANATAINQPQSSSQWDAVFDKVEADFSAEQSTDSQRTGEQEESAAEPVTSTETKTSSLTANGTDSFIDRLMTEQEEEELENDLGEFGPISQAYPPNWDEMWDTINSQESGAANLRTENFQSHPGSYRFEADNPYQDEDDPFAMGVYMMDNGAKLSTAVLCFEEAVRRDAQHVEAWARLGMAQAQNEVEDQAIIALERAVALNPQHERALLNLAISYTNEGYDAAASQLLEKWILARYPQIGQDVPPPVDQSMEALHARVMEMFLRAARSSGAELDTDVQAGLGVLCYRDDDYDKAIDCFRAALAASPNDASLWNRLGATLANASHPEEAIEAYERALGLRPSFVRARYNLAVSCINIGCYREAAEHLLSAMALHETEERQGVDLNASSSLVDTLRRVFFAMDRRDLLQNLQPGTNLDVFRTEFNF